MSILSWFRTQWEEDEDPSFQLVLRAERVRQELLDSSLALSEQSKRLESAVRALRGGGA